MKRRKIVTRVESRIYEFLRKGGKESKALACAVAIMERLLFEEKKSIYDIQVTKDIYPEVVSLTGGTPASVTRNIARAAKKCWKSQEKRIREEIIGEPCEDLHTPRDLILYLAVYAHFGIPYYEAIRKFPGDFG